MVPARKLITPPSKLPSKTSASRRLLGPHGPQVGPVSSTSPAHIAKRTKQTAAFLSMKSTVAWGCLYGNENSF